MNDTTLRELLGGVGENEAVDTPVHWIGGGSIIQPGVTIGENSVIGAGSVVTCSIPANSVAVGNPCRVVRCFAAND